MSSTPSLEKEAIIIYISGASPLVSKIGNPRKFGYEVTERNVHTLGEGEEGGRGASKCYLRFRLFSINVSYTS